MPVHKHAQTICAGCGQDFGPSDVETLPECSKHPEGSVCAEHEADQADRAANRSMVYSMLRDEFSHSDKLEINEETRLSTDLRMDSLDGVELAMCLEDQFGVEIADKAFTSPDVTVGQVLAELRKLGVTV